MPAKKFDYPALTAELEAILTRLQAGDLDVDQAVTLYERGTKIAQQLETYLKDAENKVTKIKESWEARSKSL